MSNTIYEIRIIKQATIEYSKKILGKNIAIESFRQIPKSFKQRKFPQILLIQNNYNDENMLLSSIALLKSRINLNKMKVEQVKKLLEKC